MLGNVGGTEIVILLVIVLLVFGAHRLPEAGRSVGKGLREFRRALNEARDAIEREPPAGRPPSERPSEDAAPKRLSD